MKVAIGTDHGGFALKETVISQVLADGHEVIDLGTNSAEAVDYPDFAKKVGECVVSGQAERGILLCGSGIGVNIAANKIRGIYASVCHDSYMAHQGVEHDNMNVLCLGSRVIGPEPAREIVSSFLRARFVGNDAGQERHFKRVSKVREIEKNSLEKE
jgi:ribose 5-phosphate isomerase B